MMKFNRPTHFAFIASLALLTGTMALAREVVSKSRPNILFIYTDDQSQRTLSCYRAQGAWPCIAALQSHHVSV